MPDEYQLTEDEQGIINSTIQFYQAQANAELNTLLRGIVRHRQLGDANWTLVDGKLVKAKVPTEK